MPRDLPKKPRVRNPAETRAKLLRATIDLVAENGADALSLKDVAKKANLSRGVAYQHFKDRDHLLREAKNWISSRLQDGVTRLVGASMHDRVIYTTQLVLDNPEASKLLIADALAGRDLDPAHPLYRLVLKMLKQLSASGQVRADMDLEIMIYIMLGTIATTIMLGEQHKGEGRDVLAERFTNEWRRILRDGILAKDGQPRAGKRRVVKSRSARPKALAQLNGP
jgi:AcrR family transcriptional regulator